MRAFLYLAGGVFVIVTALNYSGFCFSKMKRMSNADYINAAISEIIKYDKTGRYPSVSEFKTKHPNCCKVLRFKNGFGSPTNGIGPLYGSYTATVVLHYSREFQGDFIPYERHMYVRKCGSAFPGPGIEL